MLSKCFLSYDFLNLHFLKEFPVQLVQLIFQNTYISWQQLHHTAYKQKDSKAFPNVELSTKVLCGIYLRAISQVLMNLICDMYLDITIL